MLFYIGNSDGYEILIGRECTGLDFFYQKRRMANEIDTIAASVDGLPLQWPLSRTNSHGPKPGMKFSRLVPDSTGLPTMVTGMAGLRMLHQEPGRSIS